MKPFSVLIFPAIGVIGSPALEQRAATCNANNCLRAVRASTLLAARSSDCTAYLKVTVTPLISIAYQTLTFTSSPTTTSSATATTLILQSATVTQVSTVTDVKTSTVIQPTTIVSTVSQSTIANQKRQQTVSPTSIPAYASPCANVAEYSSACSCLGATHMTVTASTPVTTIIVSLTVSSSRTAVATIGTVSQLTTVTTSTVILITTSSIEILTTRISSTTKTTTVKSTSTRGGVAYSCPTSPYNPGAFYGDSYITYCDQSCNPDVPPQGTSTMPSFEACIYYCDNTFPLGFEMNFEYSTGACQCYAGTSNTITPSPGFSCAVINGFGIPGGN